PSRVASPRLLGRADYTFRAICPNVLVVDDDPKITQLLRRTLSIEGYKVQTADSGAAALDVARAQEPDLVILDVLMPGMDGLEVCRRLRAHGETPILMLTAKDEVSD